ncbi:MAG: class I SAM-dependent methyltransferase [Candidatus Velthaea sp.]
MHGAPLSGDFDELAGDYDRFRTGYSSELFDALGGFGFTARKRVLDVACGTGISLEPLAARGLRTAGVDPSAEMLAAARRRVPDADLTQGRAEALPFADASFDAALSAQSFHWFDQAAALREMTRVVRPGGPVAVWWKVLAADDDVRRFRTAACRDVDLTPSEDVLKGGFGAFYAAPFARRELRVIPHVARSTIAQWVGYERSRAKARAYGDRRDAYLAALEHRLLDVFKTPEARFEVHYMQYLYIGITA